MKKLSLITSFVILTLVGYTQMAFVDAVAFENSVSAINEKPVKTNETEVLNYISLQLKENVRMPELYREHYNTDVTIYATFSIDEEGQIEDIIVGNGQHKGLEQIVKKELEDIKQVTPVIENGVVRKKVLKIPVVFQV